MRSTFARTTSLLRPPPSHCSCVYVSSTLTVVSSFVNKAHTQQLNREPFFPAVSFLDSCAKKCLFLSLALDRWTTEEHKMQQADY